MDKDSLWRHRISQVVKQPNTVRGRTIVWFASLQERPYARLCLYASITLFVLVHLLAFCLLLQHRAVSYPRSNDPLRR
jgi:hypothetical protein